MRHTALFYANDIQLRTMEEVCGDTCILQADQKKKCVWLAK